jgi:Sigma-70, region 4
MPTTAQVIQARERERHALELRKGGATLAQVGEALGVSKARASQLLERALGRLPRESGEEVRRLEVERLDALLMAMWPQAMKGSGWAVGRCLEVMERRARLLGLDAADARADRLVDVLAEAAPLVAGVLLAVVDRLGLDDQQRALALEAAQGELLAIEARAS